MNYTKKTTHPFLLKILRYSVLAVAITSLFACSSEQHGDLQNYVKQIKAKQKGHVKPLPEVKPYETFAYNAHELRSPFTSFARSNAAEQEELDGLRPDINRKREQLEQFPLDTLSFVGHLEQGGWYRRSASMRDGGMFGSGGASQCVGIHDSDGLRRNWFVRRS